MRARYLFRLLRTPVCLMVAVTALSVDVVWAQPAHRAISYDLNGDGRGDLVWRNRDTGQDGVWFMNGSRLDSWALLLTVPNLNGQWTILASDDFDGDGKADLLWQHTSGYNAVWLMDGDSARTIALLPATNTLTGDCGHGPVRVLGARLAGTGDFDGDGRADILWQRQGFDCILPEAAQPNGFTEVWLMNGVTVKGTRTPPEGPSRYQTIKVGDVNGDGISDLLWKISGLTYIWLMSNDGTPSVVQMPSSYLWTLSALSDLDADGRADAVWQMTDNGITITVVWLLNGGTLREVGVLPLIPSDAWSLTNIVDTDGDGRSDFLWRAPTGHVFRWGMGGLTIRSAEFLTPALAPVEWEMK